MTQPPGDGWKKWRTLQCTRCNWELQQWRTQPDDEYKPGYWAAPFEIPKIIDHYQQAHPHLVTMQGIPGRQWAEWSPEAKPLTKIKEES